MKIRFVKRTTEKLWPVKGECMQSVDTESKEVSLYMPCPRCGMILFLGPKTGHTFETKDDFPTVSPSIGCNNCKFHGYVKYGNVEFLRDLN